MLPSVLSTPVSCRLPSVPCTRCTLYHLWLVAICALFCFNVQLVNTTARSTNYCQKREHAEGKWTFNNESASKTFVCCGWEGTDAKVPILKDFCPAKQYEYEARGNDDTSHLNLNFVGGHACICDVFDNTILTKLKRDKWAWEPDSCRLREWDATLFCNVLGNRTIMLVGDSTMQQLFATLTDMIQSAIPRPLCSSQIIFSRNDRLAERYLVKFITKYKPDFLVMTLGAHLHNYEEYVNLTTTTFLRLDQINQAIFDKGHKKFQIVIRTSQPGHVDCDIHPDPISEHIAPLASKDQYTWRLLPLFDDYMRKLADDRGIAVIDVKSVFPRPDAHPVKYALPW